MLTLLEITKRLLRGELGKHAGLFARLPALGLASVITVSSGQCAQLQILKAFGNPDQTGQSPYSPLTEGSDGVLYGTTYTGGLGNSGTVFAINKDGSNYKILHHFGVTNADGAQLYGRVIQCSDGNLYGTTWAGGTHGAGTVFKLNIDGSGYTILRSFGQAPTDGNNPPAGLLQGSDGFLYGTTQLGGAHSAGTTFRIQRDGNGYQLLHTFGGSGDGQQPPDEIFEASDGMLYGITYFGGTNGTGVVYRLNKDGTGYGIVHYFGPSIQGTTPVGAMLEGTNGILYGVTYQGGSNNVGTIFQIGKDGSGFQVLHHFQGTSAGDGAGPETALRMSTNGVLYGTTESGGSNGLGCVYALNQDGTGYTVLHHCASDGQNPYATVLLASDGFIYGNARAGGAHGVGSLFRLNTDGGGWLVLRSFFSNAGGDGSGPQGIREASDGRLYGTTWSGGTAAQGTVFGLNKDGSGYSVLHNFSTAVPGAYNPVAGVVEGTDGALYGTAANGGTNDSGGVFKVGKDGNNYANLRLFSGSDGQSPLAGLIRGSDGLLYGTAYAGGPNGRGIVFAINTNGSVYSILHSFGTIDGEGINPETPLFETADGALCGATWNSPGVPTYGSAFIMSKDASNYSVLHGFGQSPDASRMSAGFAQSTNGALYGATFYGGTNNVGAIFRINEDGSGYQLLHVFTSTGGDGQNASGELIRGWDGYLYGTTPYGGSHGLGTVFRINNDGSDYSVVYNFGSSATDGAKPQFLILGSDGAFYGVTYSGGAANFGVVFRLLPVETPQMLSATSAGGGVEVIFRGMAGYLYQLTRSSDLATWAPIATVTMPRGGVYTNLDTASPPDRAYYRAAWVP
jgi:uncharacterized repeat protein (TIGR03803 family)